ncbi:MAG: S53 family peptidase [Chloroflexota bacterium]
MTSSNRVALPGSDKKPLPDAQRVGALHPDERIEVTVRVRARSSADLSQRISALARGGAASDSHLTREQFAQQFGADPQDIGAVEDFARANGLAVVQSSTAQRSVVLAGTAKTMTAAFGVQLSLYDHPVGGAFRGRQGPIYVPSDIEPIIEGIFGLDNRPAAKPHLRVLGELDAIRPLLAAPRASFAPNTVGQLYDFPKGVDGTSQCVAIIELGGGYRTTDLQAYFTKLGIKTPAVVSVSVDHGLNQPSGPSSADGEVMLDIEVVGAVAPGAKIAVYFAPNTDQGFIDAITTAVHDNVNNPSVISISWGSPEVAWTQASMQAMDSAFQAAAALGVTVYCASGDNGANDFPAGPGSQPGNHADFPASSPHVVGCGGTHITANGTSITDEVVWNDPGGGATGGGYSTVFPRPAWQASGVTNAQRGVPDVSGDASPASGYQVRVDGQDMVIGGTSAVAPLWAGLTALVNQKRGKPLGFANPLLYALASSTGAFVDITSGNNNGFNAGPGWDPCTGLGRPDGAKLVAALTSNTPVATST